MVFSDDFLHFLHVDQDFVLFRIHQNYLVALRCLGAFSHDCVEA